MHGTVLCSVPMTLREYISAERGRAVAVAQDMGVLPVLVRQWAAGRPVPVQHCAALERATGGAVTRRVLRPADWQRIWPELATASAEPGQQHEQLVEHAA